MHSKVEGKNKHGLHIRSILSCFIFGLGDDFAFASFRTRRSPVIITRNKWFHEVLVRFSLLQNVCANAQLVRFFVQLWEVVGWILRRHRVPVFEISIVKHDPTDIRTSSTISAVLTVRLNAPMHWLRWIFHEWRGRAAGTVVLFTDFRSLNAFLPFKRRWSAYVSSPNATFKKY